MAAANRMNSSARESGGRGGHPGSDGYRPTVSLGGSRAWFTVRLSWPIVVFFVVAAVVRWTIRWRFELLLVAALVTSWLVSVAHLGRLVSGLLAVWLCLVVGLWPAARVWLLARAWGMVSRHRVRTALGEAGVSSREGRLPRVVRVRATAVGTKVTVWMRAGTAMEQLGEDTSVRLGIVRAACWAREVRLERHPRWAHLVTLHLVRRDSLAASVQVGSELLDVLKAASGVEYVNDRDDRDRDDWVVAS